MHILYYSEKGINNLEVPETSIKDARRKKTKIIALKIRGQKKMRKNKNN